LILAEDDYVIVHGRFSNIGLPVNWIAADIVRLKDGILVEHWDVIQDEATEEQSKSKAPMFGSTFPVYVKSLRREVVERPLLDVHLSGKGLTGPRGYP
jgi:hypothetical protein